MRTSQKNLHNAEPPACEFPAQYVPQLHPLLIGFEDLCDLGVTYSKEHLRRLEIAGQFPERVRLTPNRVVWLFDEVTAWIVERAQVRSIETGNQETREAQQCTKT